MNLISPAWRAMDESETTVEPKQELNLIWQAAYREENEVFVEESQSLPPDP
jgi:hypothetical protein